ncbi:hypothetical protein F5883DRAFT_8337 [Diaporthe sp. PMI_573]|nr:hypothetical protein F5883DRAFT_8337 [Diaporthaceae sp. PMI_573]
MTPAPPIPRGRNINLVAFLASAARPCSSFPQPALSNTLARSACFAQPYIRYYNPRFDGRFRYARRQRPPHLSFDSRSQKFVDKQHIRSSTSNRTSQPTYPLFKMQISNILLTVLAAGASVVSAQDSTTVMTTSLTKSVTLTKVSATASSISSAVNSTTESPVATPTTSTYFPLGNSTNPYPSGTGVMHTSTRASATATESSDETGSATGSAAASSSSSAAAAGAQTLQGGLFLGALGAVAMFI